MFKRDKRLVPDAEVFDTWEIEDFQELLKKGHSLCLVYRAKWYKESVNLGNFNLKLKHKATGEIIQDNILCAVDEAGKQSVTKNRLDRYLATTYLFSSWKKSGVRSFKIIKNGRVLRNYDLLMDAVEESIPSIKEYELQVGIYHKIKISQIRILALQIRRKSERRRLQKRLIQILKQYNEAFENQ